MEIVLLYVFFSGLIYISWMYDPKDSIAIIVLNVFFGFTCGWFVTPILIGRVAYDNGTWYKASYRRYTNGEISEGKAMKENALLANILKAIEASETEERLRAIESVLRLPHNETYGDE